VAVAAFVGAESFTDVNSAQYWGKTGLPDLTAAIDANFAMIEDGLSGEPVAATTLAASGATTLSGAVTVIGGGVTTRWDNASSLIDTAAIEVGPLAATTLAASGATALSGTVRYTGVSVNVTNGQELVTTLARGTYLYTPTEVATNTVANPTASGDWVAFINVGTNDMVMAKAANLALGGATRTLGTYDILVLRAASAAVWVEESFTDNTLGP
jgi:hypothetical protein